MGPTGLSLKVTLKVANGRGLGKATMDITAVLAEISELPRCEVAQRRKATEAFKIMLASGTQSRRDQQIFGGIMKCDVIAEGVVSAAKQVHLKVRRWSCA